MQDRGWFAWAASLLAPPLLRRPPGAPMPAPYQPGPTTGPRTDRTTSSAAGGLQQRGSAFRLAPGRHVSRPTASQDIIAATLKTRSCSARTPASVSHLHGRLYTLKAACLPDQGVPCLTASSLVPPEGFFGTSAPRRRPAGHQRVHRPEGPDPPSIGRHDLTVTIGPYLRPGAPPHHPGNLGSIPPSLAVPEGRHTKPRPRRRTRPEKPGFPLDPRGGSALSAPPPRLRPAVPQTPSPFPAGSGPPAPFPRGQPRTAVGVRRAEGCLTGRFAQPPIKPLPLTCQPGARRPRRHAHREGGPAWPRRLPHAPFPSQRPNHPPSRPPLVRLGR